MSKPSELTTYAASLKPDGCKHGLEFVPRDHLVAYMDARYDGELRVWACLALHQFPRRHRNPKKPWATCCNQCGGKAGSPMLPKHIGKHLRMDEGNVRQRLQRLESENRVEWDRDKYIAVTGDFSLPAIETPLDDPGGKCCTHLWPSYLLNKINNLAPSEIARLNEKESARQEKFETLQADFRSALRFIGDEEQDNILAAVGVKMRRNEYEPHDPDRQAEYAARQARLLVLIPEIRKVVHTFEPEVCTTPKNGVVQPEDAPPTPMNTGVPEAPTEVLKKKARSAGSGGGVKPVSSSSSSEEEATTTPKRILFEQRAVAVFTAAGKGAPTPKQVAEAWTFLPAEASLSEWTEFLTQTEPNKKARIARVQHAGAIVAVTREFARSWKQGEQGRAEDRERRKRADEHQRLEAIEMAHRTLRDPAADETDKRIAGEILERYKTGGASS